MPTIFRVGATIKSWKSGARKTTLPRSSPSETSPQSTEGKRPSA